MYTRINLSSIFVLDLDKAIDFYVNTLGMELTNDMDLGFMRWVTVGVPGQPGRDVLLELPGPPAMDEKTAEQVRELVQVDVGHRDAMAELAAPRLEAPVANGSLEDAAGGSLSARTHSRAPNRSPTRMALATPSS